MVREHIKKCGMIMGLAIIKGVVELRNGEGALYGYFLEKVAFGWPEFEQSQLFLIVINMFPIILFQILYGLSIYQHFCTASAYYFSRQNNRTKWFLGETVKLLGQSSTFFGSYIVGLILCYGFVQGFALCTITDVQVVLYVYILFSLYAYVFTLLINLVSLRLGNQMGFFVTYFIQLIATFVLVIYKGLEEITGWRAVAFRLNPIANIVISWHSSRWILTSDINMLDFRFDLNWSILYFMVLAVIVAAAGCIVVKHQDISLENKEEEG
jgi:hypothetical protein